MSKNIRSQFNYIINSNFKEGIDKRSYRIENGIEMSEKVFSYSAKFNLLDISRNFSNFLKENFYDIKMIKDITPDMIQKFLDIKAETCTKNTVMTYAQALFKMELMAEKTFKIKHLGWRENVQVPIAIKEKVESRGAESVISREDLNKILNYTIENKSQCGSAIRLQSFLGIRVQEIVSIRKQDINLVKNELIIVNSKGGKVLTKKLTKEEMEVLKEILAENYDKEKIFSIKSESINYYLRIIEDKLALERHSFHDIRRYVAQQFYDNCRKNGDSKEEATKKTSNFLNHGGNRESMLKECYIKIH